MVARIRFSMMAEMVRWVFKRKLEEFFSSEVVKEVLKDSPHIEKYELGSESVFDTVVSIINQYPDIDAKMPLVAVTTVGGSVRGVDVGEQFFGYVYEYPRLISSLVEPYSVVGSGGEEGFLELKVDDEFYRVDFIGFLFSDVNRVSVEEMKEVIEGQLVGCRVYSDDEGHLVIVGRRNGYLEVVGGNIVSNLGFEIGQKDDAKLKGLKLRWGVCEDLTVNIDVVAWDRTQRNELVDLISGYFGLYVGGLYNWNYYSDEGSGESWHIVLQRVSRRGESEISIEGHPRDRLYVDGFSVSVTAFQFVDREAERVGEVKGELLVRI